MRARVLFLDNRDSFVFNLVDEFRRLGAEVRTIRGQISLAQMLEHCESFAPDLVVLSPGPGRPEEAGVMVPWLRGEPRVPVLGICLGHQAIAVAAAGCVGRAPRPVHGRASPVQLGDDRIFAGIASPLMAARYHSLIVVEPPAEMETIAVTREDGRFKAFYPSDGLDRRDRDALYYLRQEQPRRIALEIVNEPGISFQILASRLPISASTLSFHLAKLRTAGLVEEQRAGREKTFTVPDAERVRALILRYRATFVDTIVDRFADAWLSLGP